MNREAPPSESTSPPLPSSLLASYSGPALLIAPDDRVHAWNDPALDAAGLSAETLAKLEGAALFKGAKKRSFRHRLKRARDHGLAELTAPFQTPEGPGPERQLHLLRVGAPDSPWVLMTAAAIEPDPVAGGPSTGLCTNLMEALPCGVLVFQGQRLEYANGAAANLLNRSGPEALTGLMMASVVFGDDRERMGELLGQAAESGRADARLRLLDAEQRPVETEASLALMGDPTRPTLQLVFHPLARQRGLERALRQSEERYRSLIGSLDEGFWMGGGDGGTADVNQALQEMLGFGRAEMLDRPLTEFAAPDERDRMRQHLNQLEEGEPRSFETHLLRKDRHTVPVGVRMVIMPDPSTGIPALFAFISDLSAQWSLRERLRRETGLNEAILGSLPGIFFLAGADLGLTRWNSNLSALTGQSALDLAGRPAPELFVQEDRERVRALLEDTANGGELEANLQGADGQPVPFGLSVAPVDLGDRGFVAALGLDITQRKALEADLERMATVDALTGVWNRAAIDRQLEQEIERTRRYGNQLSLVLIDLDRFHQVNDHYDRETGDRLLAELAGLIGANKRAADFLARWSGDQFLVLAPDTDLDGATTLAEHLHQLIGERDFDPVALVGSTIGVTAYHAGDDANRLIERLEGILHEAKRRGRSQVMVAEA